MSTSGFAPTGRHFTLALEKHQVDGIRFAQKTKTATSCACALLESTGRTTFMFKNIQDFLGKRPAEKKRSLIAHFGRIEDGGLLANFTDGGEGVVNPSADVISASRARLMNPSNPMRTAHIRLNSDPEIAQRRTESLRSQEVREKHRKNAGKHWSDPAKREALAGKMRAVWAEKKAANPPKEKPKKRNKEELAEYRRNLLKERNADPEYRTKRVAALQAASDKISAGVNRSKEKRLATLATPEVQAKLRQPKTEAHKKKCSDAKKLWWAKKKAESTN
jgi:plasmid maintenance system killer protein